MESGSGKSRCGRCLFHDGMGFCFGFGVCGEDRFPLHSEAVYGVLDVDFDIGGFRLAELYGYR